MKGESAEGDEYFGRVAANWDKLRRGFFSESLREKAIDTASVKGGKIAVDVGAGTGFITEELVNKGLKVFAHDQSKAMLNQMRRRYQGESMIDFQKGETENLPIADGTADYVFANMLLHNVENPSAAIKEMERILKEGGALMITDLDKHNFEFLRKEQHDRWMGFDREDVRKWFKQADLRVIRVDCAEDCCAQSIDNDESARVSIFIASGKKKNRAV